MQPEKSVNILTAAREGHIGGLKTLCKDRFPEKRIALCIKAAKGGSIDVLNWLKERNFCNWCEIVYAAAGKGHLDVVKWCVDNFTNTDLRVASCAAARKGHLEVLKWMKERKYDFGYLICVNAAKGGQLEILKWLFDQQQPHGSTVLGDICGICYYAAISGHMEILKWAREKGCPWGWHATLICTSAAKKGYFEVARWAKENGCPFETADDIRVKKSEVEKYLPELIEWCKENECKLVVD